MADDIAAKAKHLGGRIKEGLGDALGDRKMEREGQLSQVEGQSEQDAARAAEALEEATLRKEQARIAREQSERQG